MCAVSDKAPFGLCLECPTFLPSYHILPNAYANWDSLRFMFVSYIDTNPIHALSLVKYLHIQIMVTVDSGWMADGHLEMVCISHLTLIDAIVSLYFHNSRTLTYGLIQTWLGKRYTSTHSSARWLEPEHTPVWDIFRQ